LGVRRSPKRRGNSSTQLQNFPMEKEALEIHSGKNFEVFCKKKCIK
jgi:hypothetical protein